MTRSAFRKAFLEFFEFLVAQLFFVFFESFVAKLLNIQIGSIFASRTSSPQRLRSFWKFFWNSAGGSAVGW
jgi:hypothetical protein